MERTDYGLARRVMSDLLAKALIIGCVVIWIGANVCDRRHPKLGHPSYGWHRMRPQPMPWPVRSISLRADQTASKSGNLRPVRCKYVD